MIWHCKSAAYQFNEQFREQTIYFFMYLRLLLSKNAV